VIGGGSTYTPELMDCLIGYRDRIPIGHPSFDGFVRLAAEDCGDLARRMLERHGHPPSWY